MRLIRVRLVLVNLNPINDTYILKLPAKNCLVLFGRCLQVVESKKLELQLELEIYHKIISDFNPPSMINHNSL